MHFLVRLTIFKSSEDYEAQIRFIFSTIRASQEPFFFLHFRAVFYEIKLAPVCVLSFTCI